MDIINIILKKKNKEELSFAELAYAFNSYLNNNLPDYQMSALLMAITINGMSFKETVDLTKIFIESGEVYTFSKKTSDKHSTGGIGDTTSLIVGPIVASLNIPMIKMSGKGLGYTGGTIDKLNSIPGYKIELTKEEFDENLKTVGLVIASQTDNLVPLDKIIYALRDITGTTESIPLIASSIMSKKIACGANYIVIDIKVGEGALIKTKKDALILSEWLINIGESFNKKIKTIITSMDQPLSSSIGNALEVLEAIEVLNGKECRLKDVSIEIAANIISLAKNISINDAKILAENTIRKNNALKIFEKWIETQGGDLKKLEISTRVLELKSKKDGIISAISALNCGKLVLKLGAGRLKKDEVIDYSVGMKILKEIGDQVKAGDTLAKIYVKDLNIKFNSEELEIFSIKL